MAKALQDVKLDDEKHLAELQCERDEVTRLKAEMEKMTKEHASKIEKVTTSCTAAIIEAQKEFEEKAKDAAAATEKELKAEIEKLKEENRLQKEEADKVANKMLEWTSLASDLNHKMESKFPGLSCFGCFRVILFYVYSSFFRVTLSPACS